MFRPQISYLPTEPLFTENAFLIVKDPEQPRSSIETHANRSLGDAPIIMSVLCSLLLGGFSADGSLTLIKQAPQAPALHP